MRALTLALAAVLVAAFCGVATGQSLSPMEHAGTTPSAVKGFRLNVGNPYPRRMAFVLTAMQPAEGATIRPERVVLAPGHARPVLFAFQIDPALKERTIALCISPENVDGPILPRVCGRYTGRMLAR
jgi:hypothetical protein